MTTPSNPVYAFTMTKKRLITLAAVCMTCALFAQNGAVKKGMEAIRPDALQAQLDVLSSDAMMGRNTGEKGGFVAARYVASLFATYGVIPGGDMKTKREEPTASWGQREPERYRSYFQDFSLIRYRPGTEQKLEVRLGAGEAARTVILDVRTDYRVSAGTCGVEFTAPVVFVGYGIRDAESGWDDLKDFDLTGKILVRCYGYPGKGDTLSKGYAAFGKRIQDRENSPLAKRNDWIKGALAVIDIPEGVDPAGRWTVRDPDAEPPDWYDGDKEYRGDEWEMTLAEDSIGREPVRITLSKRAWILLSEGAGIDPDAYKQAAAQLKPVKPRILPGTSISLLSTVESEIVTARNVVGFIPGKDTTRCVVVGAHYDHMGSWEGFVFNGADDNASGTIGVAAIAAAIMGTGAQPPVTVVLAAWTAEEKGLLGSEYYVRHPLIPMDRTILNVNFDMISRNAPSDSIGNKCSVAYPKDREDLKKLNEITLELYNIDLDIRFRASTGQWGGSDYVPFARKGVPFLANMAGFHTDYHTPKDDSWRADAGKMARIIRLNFAVLWELSGVKEP